MPEKILESEWFWGFLSKMFEEFPIPIMIIAGLFLVVALIWFIWYVYKKIKWDNHIKNIANDVKTLREYIVDNNLNGKILKWKK